MRLIALVYALTLASPAHAAPVSVAPIADHDDTQIHVAQVERVFDLTPSRGEVRVRVVLQHTGGSTDVSPHYRVFVALYDSGEMCNGMVAYDLGPSYLPVKPKQLSGRRFRIKLVVDEPG